jgi:hypothetical protein
MKPFQRIFLAVALLSGLGCLAPPAGAQTPPLAIDQTALLVNTNYALGVNWQSGSGVPLSDTKGTPAGSDGRESITNSVTNLPPTTNQYSAFVGASGVPVQGTTNLNSSTNFAANVTALNWPRVTADGTHATPVIAVLRSAQVGAPYFSQEVSYYFGAIIPPPGTDENGNALTNISNLDYWVGQPYTTNTSSSNMEYYYSPNAQAVFATQSGGIDITWQKAAPSSSAPPDYASNPTNYLVIAGSYYRLYTVHYLVSGAAVKTPRQIYWTEGSHAQTGHPVSVPQASVNQVNVIYNNSFPQYVTPGDLSAAIPITNTLWFTSTAPLEIKADNVTGRVFVELLGELNPDGVTRRFLGFEIVDVSQEPVPTDINVNLGEQVPAYADGTDYSTLTPSPIQNPGTSFYYQEQAPNSSQVVLWATQETINLNDFQVYWLVSGVAGLQWPYLFDRYHLVWSTNSTDYVDYLRPLVSTAAEAAMTSVQLPAAEAPTIAYQDPLDQPRAFLSSSGVFYTFLSTNYPAHRTLIQFLQNGEVSYERVFSFLDIGIKNSALFTGSVATNLDAWDPINQDLAFASIYTAPYAFTNTVSVGARIEPPIGVRQSLGGGYWAGYIMQANGNAFNPEDYVDPFVSGFQAASLGSIIPVNAVPGNDSLDVWWFRSDNADASLGFQPSYWPAVIGHYNIQWPSGTPEIIMANNAGVTLDSLQANGTIYRQDDPTQPGYNPNEEHAVLLGGQVYALRDDLNVTNGPGFTSLPCVLINYTDSDGLPSMGVYHVRREAPEEGYLFDYVVNAGTKLQAPMPLPLLALPIEGSGAYATNYNTAPAGTAGDLPPGWTSAATNGPFGLYANFTFQDRQNAFWVYRGLNAGLPPLAAGTYNAVSGAFGPLIPATAVVNMPFAYYLHVSRLVSSMTVSNSPTLPAGLSASVTTNGIAILGTPLVTGSNTYLITIQDLADNSVVTNSLSIKVVASGMPSGQSPLIIVSTNQYSGTTVAYTGRPPFLAEPAAPSNSFTMRFYYENQAGFDWPGYTAPPVGAIVPYLLPKDASGNFVGDPTKKTTTSQDIVYRPVWPSLVDGQPLPTLYSGQTLTEPINGLPEVRGQSSVQVLYEQSIATNNITEGFAKQSVALYDPTVQKTASLPAQGLSQLPAGVVSSMFEGKYYFPTLPPNLATRLWFDPSTTNLVFQGQFVDDIVGEKYLMLNVLAGADLAAVQQLCPASDLNYIPWTNLVASLSAPLYTFHQTPGVPGSYVNDPTQTITNYAGDLVAISSGEQQVDSYALSATGPGVGYVSFVVGNTINPAFSSDPVTVYIIRAAPPLFPGELKVIPDANPLSVSLSFQHTADLAGRSSDYLYDWRIMPPVDGLPPTTDPTNWTPLAYGSDLTHYTMGGSLGIESLGDNYVAMRYRDTNVAANPADTNWSPWTAPVLAPGYISRVVAGINPFDQTTTDLFDNPVNTTGTVIAEAGHRWEGDVALNAQTLTNAGLIEIYETVLHQGENISIDAGYNYGPANSALLLITGYLNDLYNDVANDAWANAQNPTISIGTDNTTYGNLATSLFCFQGEVPSLLEQDLALLRGRDDTLEPGVELAPVYNRLYWNYTLGINAGEVIYALNYNIQDENGDGVINAADAAILYPMGHGDAYGHYLTALTYYYQLLLNPNFDWVPQIEAVSVLGATVSVNYEDERKFASTAASLARTGEQVFDLTWREGYQGGGTSAGWSSFGASQPNTSRPYNVGGGTAYVTKYWGLDHWATRTDMGAYLNWVVGNAILPPVDPNPADEGIQKVDRTTVPELVELPQTATQLQADMDNAEAGFTPLNLSQNAIPFDINPLLVTGANPQTHFEQIYSRALVALNNAVDAFNNAQGVTQELRQEQNSLTDFQASVTAQELAYNDQLIELYGTPYPEDMGPGQTYPQGYTGPDLLHYTYVENPDTNTFGGILNDPTQPQTYLLDVQQLPQDWTSNMYDNFNFIMESTAPGYASSTNVVPFTIGPDGFFNKPAAWTSQRGTVGSIQQAISQYIAAENALRNDAASAMGDKQSLDKAMNAFTAQETFTSYITSLGNTDIDLGTAIASLNMGYAIENQWTTVAEGIAEDIATTLLSSIPTTIIAGLAFGGNVAQPAAGAAYATAINVKDVLTVINAGAFTAVQAADLGCQIAINENQESIANAQMENGLQNAVLALGQLENSLQGDLGTLNDQLRKVSDAQAAYQALVAQGNRIQAERLTFRQHAAAVIQGYRTSDQAFILFQNEDLQRYQTLFNLAAEYAFLAAQAYDYETGLLNTTQGKAFLNQIISSQAIGVVNNGVPQAGASDGGDPGLAGALAEMDADWQVLKGRLGFNNPDGYGTTVSLRTENYRILGTSDGDANWQQVLQQGRVADLLSDPDVERYCLQIDDGSGLPVPGIILNFSTIIADGMNLFGNPLAPGDHDFSPSSFATKIFSVGVDFDGYIGMDNPSPNGGTTPADPSTDPNALAATPYVYLIPVGVDSMRSPPLGDASAIRTWNVDDVTIPLPFNIGGSDYSSQPFYTSADSLTEPLFAVRGNEAFRPVSSTDAFSTSIYGASGALQPSQFTNQRLIGRSIWNSKWKLVIPGRTLLSDPNQGLARFIASVKDVKLYFITYSYSGN